MAIYARKRMVKKTVRKSRRVSKKPKLASSIRKYVKKEVHRNIENKEKLNFAANQTIITSDATTCTYPLLMNIIQGTQDDNRIGNQIRTVKGVIKLALNLLPYDAITNPNPVPVWVRIWVVRDLRNAGQLSTMDITAYNNFYRGNGSGVSMQGNPLDTVLEVNKDYFRVLYSKVIKLGVTSAFNAGIPINAGSYFDNSDMGKVLTINWGKWCKKQIKFNETSNYPNNDNLYIVFQPVSVDGTTSGSKRMVELHYANYQHFEDA